MAETTSELLSPFGRIVLVTPLAEHDEAIAAIRSDAKVREHLQFLPERTTTEEVAARRETRAQDPRLFDVNILFQDTPGSDKVIGSSGYFNVDTTHGSCEAGIIIAPEYQRQSVGTEVFYVLLDFIFEEKKFHRVTFETAALNMGMRGWLENGAGIKLEGNRRDAWRMPDGSYADVASYAVLEHEWRGHVKGRLRQRLEARGIAFRNVEGTKALGSAD